MCILNKRGVLAGYRFMTGGVAFKHVHSMRWGNDFVRIVVGDDFT